MRLNKGDRVYFKGEKRPYTVRAIDNPVGRFAVLTRPFNLKKTVQYTIIDRCSSIRGTENLIFCMGFETDQECEGAIIRLEKGESEVSHRNRVALNIVNVVRLDDLKK